MDLVYTVRPGDRNEELRYSLRSVARNLPHEHVWIVGYKPSWVTGVRYLPTEPQGHYPTQTHNWLTVCEHPDTPDEFVLMNDDFFVVSPIDQVPVMHGGTVDDAVARHLEIVGHTSPYIQGMIANARTLARYGIRDPLFYDLHVPMPVEREPFADALRLCKQPANHMHKRTLYGNLNRVDGEQVVDVKVTARDQSAIQRVLIERRSAFLSTDDQSFMDTKVGRWMINRFTRPCEYENGPGPFDGPM